MNNLKLDKFIPGPIIPCKMCGKDYDLNLINFLYNINRLGSNFNWIRNNSLWQDFGKALEMITPYIAETISEIGLQVYRDYKKYMLNKEV